MRFQKFFEPFFRHISSEKNIHVSILDGYNNPPLLKAHTEKVEGKFLEKRR